MDYSFLLLIISIRSFWQYRKILKTSLRAYIFQKVLFEGLIFGEAYIRRDLYAEGSSLFKVG